MDTQEAFLRALEAHKKILYKVAALYCANPEDRKDLVQETVIQLWRSYQRFDARSSFATWMYRVALNTAISWVRDDRRDRERFSRDEGVLDASLADAAANDSAPELRLFLAQVMEQLDPLDRALILLYLEGHDHPAIAEVLGLTPTNVATKIGRIKQRLQRDHGDPR